MAAVVVAAAAAAAAIAPGASVAAGGIAEAGERGAGENPYRAAAESVRPSLVLITGRMRRMKEIQGFRKPGIVASEDGLLISDGSIRSEDYETTDLAVALPDGTSLPCSYVGKDEDLNLAFLQIGKLEGRKLVPLRFGREAAAVPDIGDGLIAVGLLDDTPPFLPKVARGMVTARTRDPLRPVQTDLDQRGELDLPCPVLDSSGRNVVGLLAPGAPSLLIPAAAVASLVVRPPRESDDGGEKAWLGIVMQALTPDLAEYWKIPEGRGVVVGAVVPGSPVESVGIRPGDVITSFDGWQIPISHDSELPVLIRRVKATPVGKAVQLVTYRGGERRVVEVKLGARPKSGLLADAWEDHDLGLAVREITFDHRLRMNLAPSDGGVLVDRIEPAGWAALGGMRPFDIIQRVDNIPCADVKAFREAIGRLKKEKPKKIVFMVKRGVDSEFVVVTPDWEKKTEEE
ncbi:MAG: PDZ domain-containing protein [Planctomycetota bacterium]|nr:PDZ domain-containing protein [Planctomycetota bacterium]